MPLCPSRPLWCSQHDTPICAGPVSVGAQFVLSLWWHDVELVADRSTHGQPCTTARSVLHTEGQQRFVRQ